MTVCEYIDSILKARKISRRQLAFSAGIPTSSLQAAFERNTNLSYDMLFPILEALRKKGIDKSEYNEILKISGIDTAIGSFQKAAEELRSKTIEVMISEVDNDAKILAERIADNPDFISLFEYFEKLDYHDQCDASDLIMEYAQLDENKKRLVKELIKCLAEI